MIHNLSQLLLMRSCRELKAISRAYGISSYDKYADKQSNIERLLIHLLDENRLPQAYHQLDASAQASLCWVRDQGGQILLREFQHRYGSIRPYQPWRSTHTNFYPWENPCSITEHLWYSAMIGIIKGRHPQITIAKELLPLLPPRTVPIHSIKAESCKITIHATAVQQIAYLLALLYREPVCFVRNKQLPITSIRQYNQLLSQPFDLSDVRAETQLPHLRIIRYLAEVAGFLTSHDHQLWITSSAWEWLGVSWVDQMDQLWNAVQQDLESASSVWEAFGFPQLKSKYWQQITQMKHTVLWSIIKLT